MLSPIFALILLLPATRSFEAIQPELFSTAGAQPNAWADFDNDGDLDLYVGMRYGANRLYRNDGGTFVDVAPDVGLDVVDDTRAASWGDYDGDGDLDLYIGFPFEEGRGNRLYRNEGDGRSFTDVAPRLGLDDSGVTRQVSFIDYDNDGDLDLFVAFRDRVNRLYRNEGNAERFTDVTESSGIADPRRTVGVVWFDMDEDGDLDAFVTNQNGDNDGVFRNDGGRFTDVAKELGMDGGERSEEIGGVGPAVVDYDNDGNLDLFVAMYGPDVLFRNEGDGRFSAVDAGPVNDDYHSTSAAWGDYDNDGWPDLFVVSYLNNVAEVPDHLYRNVRGGFENSTPQLVLQKGASHGVQWADFDGDGDLDLALANNHPDAAHPLYRNVLDPDTARRSLQVFVSSPGAEVRIFRPGTREVLGARLVDTGGGYCSQSVMPVHFGLGDAASFVDVEVTTFGSEGRTITRVENVEPNALPRRVLAVATPR